MTSKTVLDADGYAWQWERCMVCADQVWMSDYQQPGADIQWVHCVDNTDLCICGDTGLGYVEVLTLNGTFSSRYVHGVQPVEVEDKEVGK